LPGGTHICQPYALAGTGSECVVTLMEALFSIEEEERVEGGFEGRGERVEIVEEKEGEKGEGVGLKDNVFESVSTMRMTVGRVIRVLKASVGADPRSGAGLRVYVFNKGLGFKLI
jgi:hypothetical protein